MTDTSTVRWFGRWEHACGDSGEDDRADEDTPQADHECDQDDLAGQEDPTWYAEWSCDNCGASGDAYVTDGMPAFSDHVCGSEEAE